MKKTITAITLSIITILSLGLTIFAESYTPTGNGADLLTDGLHNVVNIQTLLFSDYHPSNPELPISDKTMLIEYPQTYWTGYTSNVDITINTNSSYNGNFAYTWVGANLQQGDDSVARWIMTGQRAQAIEGFGTNFLIPSYYVGNHDYIAVVDPASSGSIHVVYDAVYERWYNGQLVADDVTEEKDIPITAGTTAFASFLPDALRNLPYEVFVVELNVKFYIDCHEYILHFNNVTDHHVTATSEVLSFFEPRDVFDDFDLGAFWRPLEALFTTPLFGPFTLGGILSIAIGCLVVVGFLKLFAGG